MRIPGIKRGKKAHSYNVPVAVETTYSVTPTEYITEQFTSPVRNISVIDNTDVTAMSSGGFAPINTSFFDGDKFDGGFGITQLYTADLWTLRLRSEQLFTENLYAEGMINRLVTNEINIGLSPDVQPDSTLLPVTDEFIDKWSENVENRFSIWAKNAQLCDARGKDTFGALQRLIKTKALVSGDVLVTLKQNKHTKLPMLDIIDGSRVRSPFITNSNNNGITPGHTVTHGVERNRNGVVVAYWVQNTLSDSNDIEHRRILARSPRTNRLNAWLVFGTEKTVDNVRGMPMLAIVLQSLKEIDRYRDSTLRKSVVNSLLAMFIKKTDDKASSLPLSGSAVRAGTVQVDQSDGTRRDVNVTTNLPGTVAQELQTGEEPVLLGGQGTDVNFATFEASILNAYAWAKEIPPEILTLSFNSNYSASQAATNEFKSYLRKSWVISADTLLTPVYKEFLISEVLKGKIKAPGFLDSWRDPSQYDTLGAWVAVNWYGTVKPSTDSVKQAKGSKIMVEQGWSTNAREAREINGSKFTKNIKALIVENKLKAEAATPLAEFQAKYARTVDDVLSTATGATADDIITGVVDALEDDQKHG